MTGNTCTYGPYVGRATSHLWPVRLLLLLLLLLLRRSTTKYWVAPRHVMRVQLAVLRHLPLLIFGRK